MEKHSLSPALSLALTTITAIALNSCARTQYVAMPEVHQRDSLVSVVHKNVNNTRVERFHIERLLPADTLNPSPFKGIGGSLPRGVVIFDSIYVEKYTDIEVHDTVVVTRRDTITIPVPVEPPPRKSLALSERVRVLGKGCLIGGIGAFLFLVFYIALRLYLRR